MGSVDLSVLNWELFWTGAAFLMTIGSLFSFSMLRFVQKKFSQAIASLVLSVASFAAFMNFVIKL